MTKKHIPMLLYSCAILAVSYFTYFQNYDMPNKSVWDERYTVPIAYRYLRRDARPVDVGLHPPLGFALVALGEAIVQPNAKLNTDDIGSTYYVDELPTGFSFKGVRLIPVIMGSLSPLLFFILLYSAISNVHYAGLFSALYLFDNALIVQSRTANLDGMQLFFILLALIWFTRILKNSTFPWTRYIGLGLLIAIAIMIKVTSAILIPLVVVVGVLHLRAGGSKRTVAMMVAASIIVIVASVALCNMTLRRALTPLDNSITAAQYNYFQNLSSTNMFAYRHLAKLMPDDDTFASHPLGWIVGHKSICYRGLAGATGSRFIYFHGNPAVWLVGLLALALSTALVIAYYVFGYKPPPSRVFSMIRIYLMLYGLYMLVFLLARRAVYLPHYIIPLVLSLLIAYYIFFYIFGEHISRKDKVILVAVIIYTVQIIAVYRFFSPLSYYQAINRRDFNRRAWVQLWGLEYGRH